MWKKLIIAWVLVFIAVSILGYVLHSLILMGLYEETKNLWRPMEEMKWGVSYMASAISTFFFVLIYIKMISPKSLKNAILYGLFWGIAAGSSMGYGSYSSMPMPYALAAGWFWGTIVEITVGGLVLGLIVKDNN